MGQSSFLAEIPPWKLVPGDWDLAPKAQLDLSMYLPLFVRKYRPKYRALCCELRRRLHR